MALDSEICTNQFCCYCHKFRPLDSKTIFRCYISNTLSPSLWFHSVLLTDEINILIFMIFPWFFLINISLRLFRYIVSFNTYTTFYSWSLPHIYTSSSSSSSSLGRAASTDFPDSLSLFLSPSVPISYRTWQYVYMSQGRKIRKSRTI